MTLCPHLLLFSYNKPEDWNYLREVFASIIHSVREPPNTMLGPQQAFGNQ